MSVIRCDIIAYDAFEDGSESNVRLPCGRPATKFFLFSNGILLSFCPRHWDQDQDQEIRGGRLLSYGEAVVHGIMSS